ncbi:hypothetical protein BR93DRAFT_975845 [Coniochaeta sp. PMI_546]|nr:hypothetical protein BR93DRAFT_975845 [Coniochaeta sp. PMI_546]
MSGLKDIVKHGWHPDKDVPIKDSLKGLVGKGDKKERTYHTPTPITSLRDPASFPPPPKHVATGATPSPPPGQPYRPPAAGAAHQSYTSTHTTHAHEQPTEEPPAPKPYRIDTTGLSTSHLPPPPVRRPGGATSTPSPPPAHVYAKPAPPSLPPRLPPRTSTPTSPAQPPPPPARTSQAAAQPQGYLNQSAISSLSSKGISVPGFGIGSTTSTSPQSPQAPGQSTAGAGTTWAQKRAALQTASSLHKDPTSVSASDAASAAATFNNLHQRHGEQLSSVAGRVNAAASGGRAATPPHPPPQASAAPGTAAAPLVGKKKPPPPPPPAKKPALVAASRAGAASQGAGDAPPPPPVPLATRPQF